MLLHHVERSAGEAVRDEPSSSHEEPPGLAAAHEKKPPRPIALPLTSREKSLRFRGTKFSNSIREGCAHRPDAPNS